MLDNAAVFLFDFFCARRVVQLFTMLRSMDLQTLWCAWLPWGVT